MVGQITPVYRPSSSKWHFGVIEAVRPQVPVFEVLFCGLAVMEWVSVCKFKV